MSPNLTLNLGVRYELDTDVKNLSGYDEISPLVRPFLIGDRKRDSNNLAPRIGFNWSTRDGRTSIRGGYGIYYDRVTLEIASLERGLDGSSLAIEVRAGNVFFSIRTLVDFLRSHHRSRIRSPDSFYRAQGLVESTLSTISCRTRWCSR